MNSYQTLLVLIWAILPFLNSNFWFNLCMDIAKSQSNGCKTVAGEAFNFLAAFFGWKFCTNVAWWHGGKFCNFEMRQLSFGAKANVNMEKSLDSLIGLCNNYFWGSKLEKFSTQNGIKSSIKSHCLFYLISLICLICSTDEFCILFYECFNQLARMTWLFICLTG